MKKTITMMILIMSMVGIMDVILLGYQGSDVIIRITCIVGISILELLSNIFKLNEKMIKPIQLLSLFALMYFGFEGIDFLLPIIIFKIVKDKINTYLSMGITLGIMAFYSRENLFYMAIYIIIINLYLYEVKKKYEDNLEINNFNRGQRYESHLMENKVRNLERYLEQNNIVTSLKERNFMAQKLHDHLGHRITSSIMQLEVTKETLGKNDELAKKYLISAMENLREGMDDIREVF